MPKILLILILLSSLGCSSVNYVYLHDIHKSQPYQDQHDLSKFEKGNLRLFDSARSVEENSVVELGCIIREKGENKTLILDIRIINKGEKPYTTPDDILLIDADKKTLRLLKPEEYVYYVWGETSEEALMKASALSVYAGHIQSTQPYTGQAYTYGNIYGSSRTGYSYSGYTTYSAQPNPYSSFAGGFASGAAFGLAIRGAKIRSDIRKNNLLFLSQLFTLPEASNEGRIWFLSGKLPITLIILACDDVHTITLKENTIKNIIKEQSGLNE